MQSLHNEGIAKVSQTFKGLFGLFRWWYFLRRFFYNMSLQDLCLMGFLVIYNCCCSFLLIPLTIISACMEPGRRDKPVFDIKCFDPFSQSLIYSQEQQGRSQDFSKGASQRLLTRLSCRIIAVWRPILTKDRSRWRKYFTKKKIFKKWASQQWLLRPRYCHGVFVCSKEGLPRGGHGHPRTPPSYAPE